VRAFSADELLEAFPVRAALEALAARLAAERITEPELLRLAELLETMRAAARRGDPHDQSQANALFHATVVQAARNPTLERQWSFLEPFSRTYISVSQPGLDLLALSERHVPILEALRVRDADAASEAMHRHLMEAADLLRPMQSETRAKPETKKELA
jgi:DNA-binding GntR family transcriptional regulator